MCSTRKAQILKFLFLVLVFVLVILLWNRSDFRRYSVDDRFFVWKSSIKELLFPNAIHKNGNIKTENLKLEEARRESALSAKPFTPMSLKVGNNLTKETRILLDTLNKEKAKQDDIRLIHVIRDSFIFPPSRQPYNLENPNSLEYSNGQTPFIDSRLQYMESGFYVECGALNGERGSNTLFFEKVRKWNGLLIEADPETFRALKSKHRKAFIMNACLNPYDFPAQVQFNKAFNKGRLIHDNNSLHWIHKQHLQIELVSVQCFPLYSILLALNQTRVDYFSLDVEGDELSVLHTIPWDKEDIRMLSVEYVHNTGKHKGIQEYMERKGYDTLLKMQRDDNRVNDLIFRKKGLTH